MASSQSWSSLLTVALSLTTLASAYRPVQHCKALGDNGHYSACTSLTQYYNQSSDESDLYVRYHWYKYKESKDGWHAFALGHRMAGALMFIFYGDPTRPTPEMTVSIRSAEGHHPPRLIHDIDQFNTPDAEGRIPDVDIVTQTFEPYNGPYEQPQLHLKPTHLGIAEFIVRGYAKWVGTTVTNASTAQPMLWSSRYDQDFNGDYSFDRSIDMHAFGLGFGFIFADLINAETPIPMFGPIDELSGHKGLTEIGEPEKPTAAELAQGDYLIANVRSDPSNAKINGDNGKDSSNKEDHNPFNDHDTTPSTVPDTTPPTPEEDHESDPNTANPNDKQPGTTPDAQSQPTYTIKGKTLRDWLWHLHGFLMCLAFFVFYPLGIYLLRAPKHQTSGLSFNYHWTVQALATVVFSIAAFTGYVQSRSISLTHQYIGITIAFLIGAQMLLGWRHHISFLAFKRRTWMSRVHVGSGRAIIPLAFVNILSGMSLRQYGWFTLMLVGILMLIEFVFGAVYLRQAHVRRVKMGGAAVAEELKAQGPGRDDDVEEYFQLAGPEDEDEDGAESQGGDGVAAKKREEKRRENERLSRLDRV